MLAERCATGPAIVRSIDCMVDHLFVQAFPHIAPCAFRRGEVYSAPTVVWLSAHAFGNRQVSGNSRSLPQSRSSSQG